MNAIQFNVISKADKQVCALQESLKEYMSFETIHFNSAPGVHKLSLSNIKFGIS